MNNNIIEKAEKFVKDFTEGEGSGHDWKHNKQVHKYALKILKKEKGVDPTIVQLSALFHDLFDWKQDKQTNEEFKEKTVKWFQEQNVSDENIQKIFAIIENLSFYGPDAEDREISKEGQIVRDADRLEAMGTRGIERTIVFGDKKDIPFINGYLPNFNLTKEEYSNYKRKENSAINHVFEKYLLLRERLHTKTGKKIGEKLHKETKDITKILLLTLKSLNKIEQDQYNQYVKLLNQKRFK